MFRVSLRQRRVPLLVNVDAQRPKAAAHLLEERAVIAREDDAVVIAELVREARALDRVAN